jgi:uncharacterized repeat protein (TIGR01451 family)
MRLVKKIQGGLEARWATPAYAGWILIGFTLFFFLAAVNTMVGWLYVMGGVCLALLVVAAFLPVRSLAKLEIRRRPTHPVSAGDTLTVQVAIANNTNATKSLLQVQDQLPAKLGKQPQAVVDQLPPQAVHHWSYSLEPQQRGIYRWQTLQLRTAAPLGLFWSRRTRTVPAKIVVYPTVLALSHCPLIEHMGQQLNLQLNAQLAKPSTEGSTRSLRPYRWGDPTRLIHWRSSARYGELRVRELEIDTGGQEIVISLDCNQNWQSESFEQAVIAAASFYFYAQRITSNVKLWTSSSGLIQGDKAVLETLAAVNVGDREQELLPQTPLIWLTQNPSSLESLPSNSRWLLWSVDSPSETQSQPSPPQLTLTSPGLSINPQQPLQAQLQQSVNRAFDQSD